MTLSFHYFICVLVDLYIGVTGSAFRSGVTWYKLTSANLCGSGIYLLWHVEPLFSDYVGGVRLCLDK